MKSRPIVPDGNLVNPCVCRGQLELLLSKQSAGGGPAEVVTVIDRLARWQIDPDLAGVCEEKALAALPEPEQKDWRQLSADVGQLLKLARGHFTETRLDGTLTGPKRQQVHEVPLTGGKTYVLDLTSKQFDAFLGLEDAHGQKLAENDDIEPGVIEDARILFTPPQTGTYRLVATSFEQCGTGGYTLLIREFTGKSK